MADLTFPTAPPTTTAQATASAPLKRCAIVGTARSFAMTPWDDQTLEIWGLNDGYMLQPKRITRWYDLHPWHQMHFRTVSAQQGRSSGGGEPIPFGAYLRPQGHLDWLRSRPFPVYTCDSHPDIANGRVFPRDAILQWFAPYWPMRFNQAGQVSPGPDYEVSTPSWMLMHALAEGYREIVVTGIHLATEWEYVEQRPNFEFLLGVASGLGVKILLPDATPICKARYRYAYEPKADLPLQLAHQRIGEIKAEGLKTRQTIAALPSVAWNRRSALEAKLRQLDVDLMDAKQQVQRAQVAAIA